MKRVGILRVFGDLEGGIEMSDSCEARKREGGTVLLAGWSPGGPDSTAMTTLHQNISPCYDPKKTDFSISISRTQKVHFLHIFDSHLATGEGPELIFELLLLLTTRDVRRKSRKLLAALWSRSRNMTYGSLG